MLIFRRVWRFLVLTLRKIRKALLIGSVFIFFRGLFIIWTGGGLCITESERLEQFNLIIEKLSLESGRIITAEFSDVNDSLWWGLVSRDQVYTAILKSLADIIRSDIIVQSAILRTSFGDTLLSQILNQPYLALSLIGLTFFTGTCLLVLVKGSAVASALGSNYIFIEYGSYFCHFISFEYLRSIGRVHFENIKKFKACAERWYDIPDNPQYPIIRETKRILWDSLQNAISSYDITDLDHVVLVAENITDQLELLNLIISLIS